MLDVMDDTIKMAFFPTRIFMRGIILVLALFTLTLFGPQLLGPTFQPTINNKFRPTSINIHHVAQKDDDNVPTTFKRQHGPFALTACTLAKNVAGFVEEWIIFHRLQGFDRFVIYDDSSTDNVKEILEPYILTGVVEHILLPKIELVNVPYANQTYYKNLVGSLQSCLQDNRQHGHSMYYCQLAVISDCFARSRLRGDRWVITFDVDEFFFRPLNSDGSLQQHGTVIEWLDSLHDQSEISRVYVTGIVFGPLASEPAGWTGPVLTTHLRRPITNERFEFPVPQDLYGNCSMCEVELPLAGHAHKSFIKARHANPEAVGVHFSQTTGGMWWDVQGRPPSMLIRLHHYQAMTVADALAKAEINHNEKYRFYADKHFQMFLNAESDSSAALFNHRVIYCKSRTVYNMFDPHCTSYHP